MSKRSTYLFGVFLTITIGTLLCWYLCCKKQYNINGKAQEETYYEKNN